MSGTNKTREAGEPFRVSEIFLSVQAEGANAGRSAVFVRFAGCNLRCPFCDTSHENAAEMTAKEIDAEVDRLTGGNTKTLVVFTGGEPCLQLRDGERIAEGFRCAVETNGTQSIPRWIDWVTVSPKSMIDNHASAYTRADEIKFLCGLLPEWYMVKVAATHPWARAYVQPLEVRGEMNIAETIRFVNLHPEFTISVQWHKLLGVR